MASTYSTNLAIELIGTGDQAGSWGNTTNTNLGTLIEQAISGYVTQAVSTGTDTTITIPNGATGVARNMYIELTGTGGTNTNLIVPANKKLYFIFNNSTGAVTVKVSGQTGVSVPQGKKVVLTSNGTDIVNGLNYIADFGSNSATITQLTATSATITNLTLTSLVISNLSIASANITTLTSASATITNLLGTTLTISGNSFLATSSGNVGIGTTSPSFKLQVVGNQRIQKDTAGYEAAMLSFSTLTETGAIYRMGMATGGAFAIGRSDTSTTNLTLDSSGNLGLGVTPSAWSGRTAIQLPDSAYVVSSGPSVLLGANVYFNGVNRTYISNGVATDYRQINGEHRWEYAASGTINTAISFTQAMTLDASGNLGIGTSSPTEKLDVSGNAAVTGTGYLALQRPLIPPGENGIPPINFRMYSTGTTYEIGASIAAGSEAGWTSTSTPARLMFSTTPSGSTTPVERLRITSSGNIGIGTTSPTNYGATYKTLAVNGASSGIVDVMQNGTVYGQLSTEANVYKVEAVGASTVLRLVTNGATRATLDTSGNLGLGTLPTYPTRFNITNNSVSLSASNFITIQNLGLNTSDNTNSYPIGGLLFSGYRDVRNPSNVAGIWAERSPASGGAASGGALIFGAQVNGENISQDSSLPAEVARITAGGLFGVGTTSPNFKLDVISNTTYQLRLATADDQNYVSGGLYLGASGTSDPYYYGYMRWDQTDISLKIGSQHGNSTGGILFLTGVGSGAQTERARITAAGALVLTENDTKGPFIRTDTTITFADGATLTLISTEAGAATINVYNTSSGRGGTFFATYNGTVTKIAGDGEVTDTGTTFAVYKNTNSHTVTFKNRSGGSDGYCFGIYSAKAVR